MICIYILRLRPCRRPPCKLLTCCIEIYRFYVFCGTIFEHFGVMGDHCGINLVIIWCQGSFRRALECPNVDFWWFLMTFGCPIGDIVRLLFHMLCDLRCQKACLDYSHDSWWFLILVAPNQLNSIFGPIHSQSGPMHLPNAYIYLKASPLPPAPSGCWLVAS